MKLHIISRNAKLRKFVQNSNV